ncbi:serine/threonine protein kinase [Actinomadura barringtoniae]|uniref:Serine/threonine protein kinase n=1 Tax=Actinomadura barringtoniae TaxID=1427535 RepID=A0A939PDB3_9ACTN|nr:serine/threonine-protein kinase [Actinomadura barringtoniae]MBO2450510.1 serine/threonine protein kinase [Actinomadura barringtoniae]
MAVQPLESDDPPEIGRYRVTGRLGEGGQGVVYLGEGRPAEGQPGDGRPGDGRPGERVAIKVLKTTDAAARARFVREMDAARQVAPFCTAAILDSSADGPRPYVVSEFIDGPSLQQRVLDRGPLSGGDLQRLAVNTASALAAIHGAGIVHRDLKPANVLLGPDGPRVVDFGIARAIDAETHTQLVGTPAYFAPEWLEGHTPTPASDVFAWAGTMVYAATGRPPFGPTVSVPAIMHRIANGQPDLTGVPSALYGLLTECLNKNPGQRPTARDLMVRLVDPSDRSSQPVQQAAGQAAAYLPPPPPAGPPSAAGMHTVPPAGAHQQTGPVDTPASSSKGRNAAIIVAAAVAVAALAIGGWFLVPDDDKDTGGGSATMSSGPPTSAANSAAPSTSSETSSPPASTGQTSGGQAVPASMAGTWKGTITQTGGIILGDSSSTDVTVKLTAGQSEGTADYGKWGCNDTFKVTSVSGAKVDFQETPKDSHGTTGYCIGGTTSLTLQAGKLLYVSPGDMGSESKGTLEKVG